METETVTTTANGCNDNFFIQRMVEVMLDINNKKLFSEINTLKSEVSRLNDMVSELSRKSAEIRNVDMQKNIKDFHDEAEAAPASVAVSAPASAAPRGRANETVSRPRYGDYKPEDVSVDKFFYYGRKK